jgi:hypothetical protein
MGGLGLRKVRMKIDISVEIATGKCERIGERGSKTPARAVGRSGNSRLNSEEKSAF